VTGAVALGKPSEGDKVALGKRDMMNMLSERYDDFNKHDGENWKPTPNCQVQRGSEVGRWGDGV
jgi:hypothetical protein